MISFGAFLEPGDVETGGGNRDNSIVAAANAPPAAGAVAGHGAAAPAAPAPGRAESLTAAPSIHELPAGWARLGYAVAVGLVLIVLVLAVRKW